MAGKKVSAKEPPASIVVAGASAGNIQPLVRLLAALDPQPGMAVVVVLQHREALDEEALRRALDGSGRELAAVEDGASVEAGRLYLPPPNRIIEIEGGRFRTRPAENRPGERGTIDSLLVSVARDEDGSGVAVLLHGTGGDGTLGVAAIKEAGGLTLAEAPPAEDEAELAHSNSPAAIADFVLPVEELADRIISHLRAREKAAAEQDPAEISAAIKTIAGILRNQTGHDFHGYKPGTFLRRVQRRMQVVQVDTLDAYLSLLRSQADEAQNLFNDLLIGVTQFFRDAREFELIEREVVPKLFDGKGAGDQLRVWVIGCSTGEEAYSLAILLRERMAMLDEVPHVQIFATDLDGRALATARAGRYTDAIAKDVSPERLARWFVKEGSTYCVVKELREMCIFSQHSIIKDAPFSRLDMISCRNLLIYLDTDLQSRVIPIFHFALKSGGYLFLGNSENVSRHTALFAPVEGRFRVFRRLDTAARVLPDFPLTAHDARYVQAPNRAARSPSPPEGNLARRAERVVERHAPAYVIVDDGFNVLHFSGRIGRYIEPTGGAATLDLFKLVHPDLRLELRAALQSAAEGVGPVQVHGLRLGSNGGILLVDLVVEPIKEEVEVPRGFVVLFKDGVELPADGGASGFNSPLSRDEHVERLERELREVNERLQATVEELESTNEELKSSNEEYQSLNEELQSANEELETSKEELQSVNEELTTVNGELAHRVHELDRANSDLKNLLESTQIATVFLDNDLRVMNYTPAVTDIFPLVETDIGRPIAHIKSRVAYDELQEDVRRVLRTLGSVDREVTEPETGTRYMARVLPYRSTDNFIGGVVVTFVDTTPLTRAEAALRESELRLRTLMEGIPQLVWRSRDEGDWTWASPQWLKFTGQTQEESHGRGWLQVIHPDDHERVMRAWSEAGARGMLDVELRVRRDDGAYLWHHTRSVPVRDPSGRTMEWLGTTTDVQQLKELQERQAVLVAELQHRTRNLLGIVHSVCDRTLSSSGSLDEFAAAFRDRLAALARVQGLLSRLNEGDRITFDELLRTELAAHGVLDGPADRVTLDGPMGVRLRSSKVQTLALALHELATNASKYGALAQPGGRLSVRWSVVPGDAPELRVDWMESGVAVPEGDRSAQRRGYGRELIERALPYQLEAETAYELGSGGVRCTIQLPISEDAAAEEAHGD